MEQRTHLSRRVGAWLSEENRVRPGDTILVGLSGGADSVCLLSVLQELSAPLGFQTAALHVHHGLRGETADRDAAFCLKLCEDLGIPCRAVYADVRKEARESGRSTEEAARLVRYALLEEERIRLGARYIAVAHHKEDQAETVLLNLFRGSGLRGLSGMRAEAGVILRPFLDADKEEILAYLTERGLPYCEDETNESDAYARNRVRHHVLEYAQAALNGRAAEHICAAAGAAAEADEYFSRAAAGWMKENGCETSADGGLILPVGALREEEHILKAYIVRRAAALCRGAGGAAAQDGTLLPSLTDLSARHVEAVLSLLEDRPGGAALRRVSLPGGLEARRSYGALKIGPPAGEEAFAPLTVLLPKEGEVSVSFGGETFRMRVFSPENPKNFPTKRYTKWVDYDKIASEFTFRTREKGDYFLLPGGGHKSLKSWLIDAKIPADERDRMILAASGQEIIWIVGRRLSEGAKVTEKTTKVLEIRKAEPEGVREYKGDYDGDGSCTDT